jgi:uridine phosphorylase
VSPGLGPVGEVDGVAWRSVLGLADDERPVAVVVEGTWWREDHTRRRLERLESVRELGIPDVFLGSSSGRWLIYACPYGAPRTAEVVQVAALVGARLAIQIGSCGVLGATVRPGDVVVPRATLGLDGTTTLYATETPVPSSEEWSTRAVAALVQRGVTAHQGTSVTWPTLFNQPLSLARAWSDEGHLGVDMETATTLAVARMFGAAAISMLVAWDEVLSDRSFLDPLPADQQRAFDRAEDEVYEVALQLVAEA